MQEVRAAVIGTGVMGRKYAQMIAEGKAGALRLTAVVCRSAGAQQWAKDTLPDTVRVCPSAEALYDHTEEFDAVLVVTPHKTHPALVMQAFAHGKHVLCDKPSANALAPALKMNRAAEKSGLVFAMMFHQRRYKKYMRLKKLLDDGALGEIKRVQLENSRYFRTWMYHRSGSWRSSWAGEGGGVLLNQCPHQLDLLQWLCGLPTTVRAFCHEGKWHDIEVEDDVTAYLEFPGGATGAFIASTGELPGTNRLEIACDRGKVVCENGQLTLWRLPQSESAYYRRSASAYPHAEVQVEILPLDGENPQHVGVLNAFAAHILHGTPLVADGAEGIRALMLSNAMHLSSWTGKPVSLPIDEGVFARLLAEKRLHSRKKQVKEVTFATDHSGTGRAEG